MAFHATKRSIRTSEGRRSCGAMFFLMRDWERDIVEPCLLAREIDVALDIDAASFILTISCVSGQCQEKNRGLLVLSTWPI